MSIFLYLKIILALLLSALPFVASYLIRQEIHRKNGKTFPSFVGKSLPFLKRLHIRLVLVFHRFYFGMRTSYNFRRFFHYIVLFVLLIFTFVDHNASLYVTSLVNENSLNDAVMYAEKQNVFHVGPGAFYIPLFCYQQHVFATLWSDMILVILFFYKTTDRMLTLLHNDKASFVTLAFFVFLIIFFLPRFFILAEVVTIVLSAAYIYPNMRPGATQKGGINASERPQRKIKMAVWTTLLWA